MKYNPKYHHRHSIRLKEYDYSQSGAYFITICTKQKEYYFGEIADKTMMLNDTGKMIEKWWYKLKNKFSNIKLDKYIIMPNHIHGIIMIDDGQTHNIKLGQTHDVIGQTHRSAPTTTTTKNKQIIVGANLCVHPNISRIIQWFKSMSTNKYIQNIKNNNCPEFNGKLWQRNYYDHIVRNDEELNNIRRYIQDNPINWKEDELFF